MIAGDLFVDGTDSMIVGATAATLSSEPNAGGAFVHRMGGWQVTVNSASSQSPVAPNSIASFFRPILKGLTDQAISAEVSPWPVELGGVRIRIVDSQGVARDSSLSFASPGQVNFVIPAGTTPGTAIAEVTTSTGDGLRSRLVVRPTAPGIYMIHLSKRTIAGHFVRVAPDLEQFTDLLFDPETRNPKPIDLQSYPDHDFYIALFGTGLRGYQNSVTVALSDGSGLIEVPIAGPVPQGQYEGLDQMNIGPIPHFGAAPGWDPKTVFVYLTVDDFDFMDLFTFEVQ